MDTWKPVYEEYEFEYPFELPHIGYHMSTNEQSHIFTYDLVASPGFDNSLKDFHSYDNIFVSFEDFCNPSKPISEPPVASKSRTFSTQLLDTIIRKQTGKILKYNDMIIY